MTESLTAQAPSSRLRWQGASARGADARRTCAWGFAALLSIYLGLSGGGYDIVVRSEVGLLVWWFVLLGVLIGVLPSAHVPRLGWIAAALLAAFLAWTWIGLAWSSSHELTLDEVCRLSTYLGIFLLGLCALSQSTARSMVNGLGCGIAVVSTAAILSKLAPSLFPASAQGNSFYATGRLGYPFGYPDGVGEYAALGLPLVLYMASSGRTLLGRALATGAVLPVLLCLAMTVSRGGILAAAVGVVVLFALLPDRIRRLPTFAIAAAGIAVLMLALLHRPAVRDSIAAAPASQRHSMLVFLIVTVVAAVLAQAAALLLMRRVQRPRWLQVSRRGAQRITAVIVLGAVALVIIGFAAGTISSLWHDFKLWEPTQHSNQYVRLLSVAGSHRYQYWQVAWHAFTSSPLHGIGSGTFRYYWEQHTTNAEYILNAHSLWFETLAETGIVGWMLLAGFFALVMIAGAVRALHSTGARRALIAASTAGVCAFCAAASFDWIWQIGVVPMVAMLLAAVTLGAVPSAVPAQSAASRPRTSWAAKRLPTRLVLVPCAVLALILIAIPLASTVADRASQAAVHRGDLAQALTDAKTAQAIEPGAASPYLQEALVLEQANDISGATRAIQQAIARAPDDYNLWVTASRFETEGDHPRRALADWNRARLLYPTSVDFIG